MSLDTYVWDVGHGQSVHAFTLGGETIVIDLGTSAYFSPLELLERKNISTIDMLVVTHPHGDHIDEIQTLRAKGFWVRQFYRPKWLTIQEIYNASQSNYYDKVDAYLEMSEEYNNPIPDNELVGSPNVSGGVKIEAFYSADCGRSNINNHSAVVIFEYHGIKVVIPGDNEPESWKSLLEQPYFKNSIKNTALLMASHHGRNSGYHSGLFKVISPDICVVSDGRSQDTDATSAILILNDIINRSCSCIRISTFAIKIFPMPIGACVICSRSLGLLLSKTRFSAIYSYDLAVILPSTQ